MSPTFVFRESASTLPYRDRQVWPADAFRFVPIAPDEPGASGRFELIVTRDVADELRRAATEAYPNEWFGLLLGRSFTDDHGDYTVVDAALSPDSFHATPGNFRVEHRDTAELNATAAARYPMLDRVGWWHSHHSPSEFSRTDRDEQRLWSCPQHVGLLVFTHGEPWAIAYQGPDAIRLSLADHLNAPAPAPHTRHHNRRRSDTTKIPWAWWAAIAGLTVTGLALAAAGLQVR